MKSFRSLSVAAIVVALLLSLFPIDVMSQRRGGSFGGSRSSGRSYSSPRSGGSRSFGGTRQSTPYGSRGTTRPGSSTTPRSSTTTSRNSFGGSRLNSGSDYTSRYGVPRRTETTRIPTAGGGATNYTVHRYGGMGDGFMMGYLMGSIPWYYSMPFHPAFYYSRPYTTLNPDGTTAVYPGTFQWGTLFFLLLLVGGGGYILYVWLRAKRRRHLSGGVDLSRSSFG